MIVNNQVSRAGASGSEAPFVEDNMITQSRRAPVPTPDFPRTSVRVRVSNPNHHLWNNNGTWYVHYTVHPTPLTKSRVRASLGTKDVETARQRRDELLRQVGA
jgi:hypothetical protein